jgi:predicted nucleic acid-binding protein
MNIILDTNTFVAAGFNPRSSSARILKAVEQGKINLVWNEDTRRETRKMITQIPRLSWSQFARLFKDENEYKGHVDVDDYRFIEDPDDRKFAALGEATGSIIVTNDHHLLSQRERLQTPVMTPSELLEQYGDLLRQ